MRPRRATFALNPPSSPGLPALRQQLARGGAEAPVHVLGAAVALQELDAICSGMLSGRGGPNPTNRVSLVADLSSALGQLGTETRRASGVVLVDFQSQLSRTKARLDTPQGARVIALALRPLLDRLASDEVLRAAWRDAVSTFCDTNTSAETCEMRVRQLADLAGHRGVDVGARVDTLEFLLGDDAHVLARFDASVSAPADGTPQYGRVSERRRLAICEEVWPDLPERSGVAVWLVIDNASLEAGFLQVGPISLFNQTMWPDGLRADGTMSRLVEGFVPPPELADDEASSWFDNLTATDHRLFARVWLDDVPTSVARERAREVLQAMIDLAKSDSAWILLEGEVSWRDGGGWSGSTFEHPVDVASANAPVHPIFERTAANLKDFSADFVRRWLASDGLAVESVDDALWTVAVERAPAAPQRVVLAIRSLERTLSRAREAREDSWSKAANRYLRAPWVKYTLNNQLFDAGLSAVHGLPRGNTENETRHQRVQDAVLPMAGAGQRRFSKRGLVAMSSDALDALPEGSMDHRQVRDAVQVLTSSTAAIERLDELGARFDSLLGRSERLRNALVHGTGVHGPTLATIDHFLVVLARYVAQEAMRQAETGQEPLIELERERVSALDCRDRLVSGEDPLDVLAPDD